jgi:stress response protein YsnF
MAGTGSQEKPSDTAQERPEEIAIPVVSEELHPGTRQVVTGGVRVIKRTVPHEEVVQRELRHDRVEVRRVQVNREVEGPLAPREEGDTLVVPVMEEVLRVERVWVLKEEIHLRRVTSEETHEERVTVSREEAEVEKLDGAGNPVASYPEAEEAPVETKKAGGTRLGGESVLGGAERTGRSKNSILPSRSDR